MEWVYDLAEDARQRVGVNGHPTTQDLLQLADKSGVRVEHRPVPCPYCTRTENGPVIVLPLSWRGDEEDESLCHEVAHALTHPGGGHLLRFLWPDNPKIARLSRLWDRRDEAIADAFVQAWFRR